MKVQSIFPPSVAVLPHDSAPSKKFVGQRFTVNILISYKFNDHILRVLDPFSIPLMFNPIHSYGWVNNCGLRFQFVTTSELGKPTHGDNICTCVVHTLIIFLGPFQANIDIRSKARSFIRFALPCCHEQLQVRYSAA